MCDLKNQNNVIARIRHCEELSLRGAIYRDPAVLNGLSVNGQTRR
jgi:hypothetical protein